MVPTPAVLYVMIAWKVKHDSEGDIVPNDGLWYLPAKNPTLESRIIQTLFHLRS